MTGGTLCFRVIRPSVRPSVTLSFQVPLCVQRPVNSKAFRQMIIYVYCNGHMLYMCTSYFVLTLTSIKPVPKVMFNWYFLHRSSLMGYHFTCNVQQTLCHFDILSCMYCNEYPHNDLDLLITCSQGHVSLYYIDPH